MEKYVVDGGAAHIGPGLTIGLTLAQFRVRSHNVTVLDSGKDIVVCRVERPLDFKVGEHIQIEGTPDKVLAEVLKTVAGKPVKTIIAEQAAKAPAKSRAKTKAKPASAAEIEIEDARKALAAAGEVAAEAQKAFDAASTPADKKEAGAALDQARLAAKHAEDKVKALDAG